MPRSVTPFLMFDGSAEAAMTFYVSLFADSRIISIQRFEAGGQGVPGSVLAAEFVVGGQRFRCFDSSVKHQFGFTPAMSIFVDCTDEAELRAAFERLSEGGEVLMPLDSYWFSTLYGWVSDRYGVSWQLNLP